ncbi:integral membrane-like protein [Halobacteriales archaeon QH_2_65_14]|nr:MAG: integral membrane-like protein [Halobacteriales archaeon QH_2_65_14]
MATETASGAERSEVLLGVPQLTLVALFVTALVTAQVTASKVVAIGLPVSLPVTGDLVTVPAAVFAYAVTFFASDCYTELYGKRSAQALVNVAFLMNFVLLALVWLAIWAPIFEHSPVAQDPFAETLSASTGVVVGSLLAYVVSQNWDVVVFHRIREATDGEALWLRNVASTATSQFIDTVLFITIAFFIFQGLALEDVLALIVGQYAFKLGLVVLDTPFVYLVVGLVRSRWAGNTPPVEGAR